MQVGATASRRTKPFRYPVLRRYDLLVLDQLPSIHGDIQKYRDPLHVLLEYIAKVGAADCFRYTTALILM